MKKFLEGEWIPDREDKVFCPHCGHEHNDLWEYGVTDTISCGIDCFNCDGEFDLEYKSGESFYRAVKIDNE